ncbi:hypothetical protein E2C01_059259 [Portunus trituberculatus]|uniref:Uncharacterized protein n=1 Tax=Portunus trituberculatus TaxID=210409 RepID=A0A5B7GXJ3_PORTR|nr:hypothetical protein [Portunus trituberculatus]
MLMTFLSFVLLPLSTKLNFHSNLGLTLSTLGLPVGGLTVSAQKSSLLCFTRRRIPNIPMVTINGSPSWYQWHQ